MSGSSVPRKVKTALQNPAEVRNWANRKAMKIDRRLGRAIYQNAANFRANMGGNIALKKAQNGRGPQLSTESSPDVTEIKQLGVPYDEETINKVKQQYDEVIEDEAHSWAIKHNGDVYSYRLDSPDFDFAEHMPAFADLLNEEVVNAVQESYGTYFKPVRVTAYRNFHVPKEVRESDVYSDRYHTDAHTIDHLKLFVYLDETNEADGPFHVIPTEESSDLVQQEFFKHKGDIDAVEAHTPPIKFTGPAGSAALVNVSLQEHRAGIPEPGHTRDIIQFVFAPSNEPLPEDWPNRKEMWSHPGEHHNGLTRLLRY